MDVTCEVNEWSAHKVELAENVQNILNVYYRSKHMSQNAMAAKKSGCTQSDFSYDQPDIAEIVLNLRVRL